MGVAELPRAMDRVQEYEWGAVPLTWEGPRFGAVEASVSEQPRRGWRVTLAEALQEEPEHVVNLVMWREAFLALLLPHVRQIPEVADLGLYAGVSLGGGSEKQQEVLNALWERVSPPQHHVYYIYDAPYGFPLFDGVVDGAFLQRVVPWLNGIRVSNVAPLTSETYMAALEQWMLETHIPLTANEVRILSLLTNTTQFKQKELAKQLDMLPSALSPALAKLAQRHILRLYNFIDLPLIGLLPIDVLLRISDPQIQSDMMGQLSTMPYAYSLTMMHQELLLGRFLIPQEYLDEFRKWVEFLKGKDGVEKTSLFEVSEIIDEWNFTAYEPGIGWIDDFSLIMEQTRKLLNYEQSDEVKSKEVGYSYSFAWNSKKPFKLQIEDFIYFRRALDTVFTTDHASPKLSQEIRDSGISESAYRRRVAILEEKKISRLGRLWLLHIGLDTVIQLFLFEDKETITKFVRALTHFPRVAGAVYTRENARLRVFVPNLQAVEVLSFLRKITAELEMNILIEAIPYWKAATGLQLPIREDNYDFKAGAWTWNKMDFY
jgi:hypothetical protein